MDPNESGLIETYDSLVGFALLRILKNAGLYVYELNRVLGNAR
jgi:hypothetical protein